MKIKNILLAPALALALALVNFVHAGDPDNYAAESEAAMAAAGEVIFNHHCRACHSADSSKNTFGPQLHGVLNRKAGSLPRYVYSDALKNSGITWNDKKLRQWINANDLLVPGTRMRHVNINDEAAQDYLIAFLKTLK
ncbi:MAG: c-type cytochrome [Motiliproteus sp.]